MSTTLIYSNAIHFGHTRSAAEIIDPSMVRSFASEMATQQYFSVALATVLVYNSLITMDKEAKYFWSKPCKPISLVYLANRYVGLLATISNITLNGFRESRARCLFSIWTASVSSGVTIVLIDYILIIRVLALYQQNRILAICLKSLFGLSTGVGFGLLIYITMFQDIAVGSLTNDITTCVVNRNPPQSWGLISWVIPMAFELILLALALYKAAEYWKLSSGFKGFHLVGVLVQDQVIYYGFVIFCSALKTAELRVQVMNPFLARLFNAAGSPTLLFILGGQLLINLKEAGERGANGGTNYRMSSMSDIEFS